MNDDTQWMKWKGIDMNRSRVDESPFVQPYMNTDPPEDSFDGEDVLSVPEGSTTRSMPLVIEWLPE